MALVSRLYRTTSYFVYDRFRTLIIGECIYQNAIHLSDGSVGKGCQSPPVFSLTGNGNTPRYWLRLE